MRATAALPAYVAWEGDVPGGPTAAMAMRWRTADRGRRNANGKMPLSDALRRTSFEASIRGHRKEFRLASGTNGWAKRVRG